MRNINLSPAIFKRFPEVKTRFVAGKFSFELEDRQVVVDERQGLIGGLGLKPECLASLEQQHGVKILSADSRGFHFLKPEQTRADGLFTGRKSLFLSVRTADCLPILFYNLASKSIGALHVGWRGTRAGILEKSVSRLMKKFACAIEDFYFYFGPAAQSCCYEGPYREFAQENLLQLKNLGVQDSQIENSGICTIHNRKYPSHRREGQERQEAILSIIGLQ